MLYLPDAEALIRPERNMLTVSFTNIEHFTQKLATTIQEDYYRNGELSMAQIGSLFRISGQVVRTHPVHPELVSGLPVEAVEMAQAGDHCDFTGTLIVVPDVAALAVSGTSAETSIRVTGGREGFDADQTAERLKNQMTGHIIIELTKTGLKHGVEGEEPVEKEDPFLVVNPNYIPED
ncbi:unnamed protein product [Coregonus sp. 'balchen']|nr:unnamed protein product [Coregonus sp. 'balchen']